MEVRELPANKFFKDIYYDSDSSRNEDECVSKIRNRLEHSLLGIMTGLKQKHVREAEMIHCLFKDTKFATFIYNAIWPNEVIDSIEANLREALQPIRESLELLSSKESKDALDAIEKLLATK